MPHAGRTNPDSISPDRTVTASSAQTLPSLGRSNLTSTISANIAQSFGSRGRSAIRLAELSRQNKNGEHSQFPANVRRQALISTRSNSPRSLRPCPNRYGLAGRNALVFAVCFWLARLSALADVDATLEEGSVFDRNAGRHYVAGERTIAADVDSITSRQVAAHFAQHHDLARVDVRRNHAITTDGYAVSGRVNGAFHASITVQRLRSGHLTLDHQRFADGGLVRSGRAGGRRSRYRCGFVRTHGSDARGRHPRTLRLPRPGSGLELICRLPHGLKILPCWD